MSRIAVDRSRIGRTRFFYRSGRQKIWRIVLPAFFVCALPMYLDVMPAFFVCALPMYLDVMFFVWALPIPG